MKKDEMVRLVAGICDCTHAKAADAIEALFRAIREDSDSTSIRG